MADAKLHTTALAKKSRLIIRGARPGRRRAFAIGLFGSFAVMLVKRGRPNSALSELKTLGVPEEAPSSAQKTKFRELTFGVLYREGNELVLQCRKRADKTNVAKARKYFHVMKAGNPWNKVRIKRLADMDEGDVEDAAEGNEELEQDSDEEAPISDADAEQNIADEWEEAEPAAATPAEPAESATPAAAAPDTAPEVPPATAEADAGRVSKLVLNLAPQLKIAPLGSEDALRRTIEQMLEHMSADRLLLLLCQTSTLKQLESDLGTSAASPDKATSPIANDQSGRAEISKGLAAFGERIAGGRGLLAVGERAKAESQIAATVEKAWTREPDLGAEQMLQKLIKVLGSTFDTIDAKRLRIMLGLAPNQPPNENWRQTLTDARDAWEAEATHLGNEIARLKKLLDDEYKSQPDVTPLLAHAKSELDIIVARLQTELSEALTAILNEADEGKRSVPRAAAEATLQELESFLNNDKVVVQLDKNEFDPTMEVVEPLKLCLKDVSAHLAELAMASAA